MDFFSFKISCARFGDENYNKKYWFYWLAVFDKLFRSGKIIPRDFINLEARYKIIKVILISFPGCFRMMKVRNYLLFAPRALKLPHFCAPLRYDKWFQRNTFPARKLSRLFGLPLLSQAKIRRQSRDPRRLCYFQPQNTHRAPTRNAAFSLARRLCMFVYTRKHNMCMCSLANGLFAHP